MMPNIANICRVIDELNARRPDGFDSIYTTKQLGTRALTTDDAPCWCLEGIIVQIVEPHRLIKWLDQDGTPILVWAEPPQPGRAPRPDSRHPNAAPSWWWRQTFGLPIESLIPPQARHWHCPSQGDPNAQQSLWRISDQHGTAAWHWLLDHWVQLRNSLLSAA